MLSKDIILNEIDSMKNFIFETRRYLHENPELSGEEFETSKFLKEEIKKLGLEINEVEKTGFYAILDTKRQGKTIAIRADIDALPIQENSRNLVNKKVAISKNDGVMHACGHDGHMSILLACAKFFVKHKSEFKGKIIFIFEEGEEQGTGINAMIDALKGISIDAIYGTHLTSFMNVGEISVDPGPVMAGAAMVWFDVIGKGGHGSRPDLSINPIFAASNILNGLTSAWSNQIDVTKTVTLGIGSINGGSNLAPNVIPDSVEVTGTLRFFDMEEGIKALKIIKNVAELTAGAHKCKVEFRKKNGISVGPVLNDKKLSLIAKEAINNLYSKALVENKTWFASESFSKYGEIAPSLFAFVGTKNDKLGSGAEHHNECFDIDEESMIYGCCATIGFVNKFLMET
ncbi:MAG: amidohydrolase [Peptoniphilus sp.]|uniref:amidohydrolase n=1 Tax=Peptoniphilus sp. TaxID=1971214 RepID=UPI0025E867D8|nr:amidohydrolase [Peptoniphilus sp.]MCI5644033.1 amidohydrolase [Peptoniphilus sp.]